MKSLEEIAQVLFDTVVDSFPTRKEVVVRTMLDILRNNFPFHKTLPDTEEMIRREKAARELETMMWKNRLEGMKMMNDTRTRIRREANEI